MAIDDFYQGLLKTPTGLIKGLLLVFVARLSNLALLAYKILKKSSVVCLCLDFLESSPLIIIMLGNAIGFCRMAIEILASPYKISRESAACFCFGF
mgnify:FL=1